KAVSCSNIAQDRSPADSRSGLVRRWLVAFWLLSGTCAGLARYPQLQYSHLCGIDGELDVDLWGHHSSTRASSTFHQDSASVTNLERILPLVGTLRDYKREDLRGDASAGLTTAVMLIPQGMAYAVLAGLPPLTGLYSALIPPLIYALFGTSRQLSVGPVAMDSLLVGVSVGAVAQSGTSEYLSAALLLAFMVGVIQLLFGLLRMGFLANLLSGPVVSGFTSAAALIIGLSQIK